MLGMGVAAVCTHLSIYVDQMFYDNVFGCGDSDVVSILSRGSVCEMFISLKFC